MQWLKGTGSFFDENFSKASIIKNEFVKRILSRLLILSIFIQFLRKLYAPLGPFNHISFRILLFYALTKYKGIKYTFIPFHATNFDTMIVTAFQTCELKMQKMKGGK